MAQQIASLEARIGANISGLEAGLRKAQAQLKSASDGFKRAGTAMTIGITLPVIGAAGALTKLAMDAEESENLFTVAMGDMEAAGRAWSEQLKADFGVSEYNARKFIGTINMMLSGMGLGEQAAFDMSKGVAQLAYDLASVYNVSSEEAIQRLQSGLAGEVEPLRRWGVSVSEAAVQAWALKQGLVAAGQELSDQQKVIARYGVIMEQTTKQQGDMARTLDSPANKLRILQERFHDAAIEAGQVFLPMASEALTWLADTGLPAGVRAMDTFKASWGEMSEEARAKMLLVGALFLGSGPLLTGIGVAIQGVGWLTAAFAMMPSRVKVAVGAALVAMIPLRSFMADQLETIGKMEDYRGGFNAGKMWHDWAKELRKDPLTQVADLTGAALDPMFDELAKKVAGLTADMGAGLGKMFEAPPPTFEETQEQLRNLQTQYNATAPAAAELNAEFAAHPPLAAASKAANKGTAESVDELKQALDAADVSMGEYIDYLVAQTAPAKAAAASVAALRLQIIGLQDQQEALNESQRAGQDALRGMQDRVSELSSKLSEAKARLSDLTNPRLVGMKAFDDQLFAIDQKIKGLQLQRLQLPRGAVGGREIDKQIAELEKQREILRLQYGLTFDDLLRQLKEAAEGTEKELTFEEALEQIGATKAEIANLTGELAAAEAAVRGQEAALRAMEQAGYALSKQIQLLQADLTLQEAKQKLVNEALQTAFTWLLEDKKKIEELGPAAVESASLVDEQTRLLLEATRTYAEGEAAAAITAIQAALDEFNRAKAEMAQGLTIRVTRVEETVSAPASTDGNRALGGPVRAGGLYLVGEHGPELFQPQQNGQIIPNGGGGGDTYNVTVNTAAQSGTYLADIEMARAMAGG